MITYQKLFNNPKKLLRLTGLKNLEISFYLRGAIYLTPRDLLLSPSILQLR